MGVMLLVTRIAMGADPMPAVPESSTPPVADVPARPAAGMGLERLSVPTPEVFEPSEKVSADSAVAFPADI